jgi:hypothetical protein
MTLHLLHSENFIIYEENFISFFIIENRPRLSIISSLNKYTVQLRVGELGCNQKDSESGFMVFHKKSLHTGGQ